MGKMTVKERLLDWSCSLPLRIFAGDSLGIANIAICSIGLLFVLGTITWQKLKTTSTGASSSCTEEPSVWGCDGCIRCGWLVDEPCDGSHRFTDCIDAHYCGSVGRFDRFMSNSAVIAMLMPPALARAEAHGIDVKAMTMAVVLPSNFAFMFPVSTPVTAIAWSAGYYTPGKVAVPVSCSMVSDYCACVS